SPSPFAASCESAKARRTTGPPERHLRRQAGLPTGPARHRDRRTPTHSKSGTGSSQISFKRGSRRRETTRGLFLTRSDLAARDERQFVERAPGHAADDRHQFFVLTAPDRV